jgi:hypothetical protein
MKKRKPKSGSGWTEERREGREDEEDRAKVVESTRCLSLRHKDFDQAQLISSASTAATPSPASLVCNLFTKYLEHFRAH